MARSARASPSRASCASRRSLRPCRSKTIDQISREAVARGPAFRSAGGWPPAQAIADSCPPRRRPAAPLPARVGSRPPSEPGVEAWQARHAFVIGREHAGIAGRGISAHTGFSSSSCAASRRPQRSRRPGLLGLGKRFRRDRPASRLPTSSNPIKSTKKASVRMRGAGTRRAMLGAISHVHTRALRYSSIPQMPTVLVATVRFSPRAVRGIARSADFSFQMPLSARPCSCSTSAHLRSCVPSLFSVKVVKSAQTPRFSPPRLGHRGRAPFDAADRPTVPPILRYDVGVVHPEAGIALASTSCALGVSWQRFA